MSDEEYQKNVLGEKLENCSVDPLTGWFRDGCCNTNETDKSYAVAKEVSHIVPHVVSPFTVLTTMTY